ncbi:MAG: hypothetical protein VB125_01720, partial [Burkholderia sp.]
FVSIIMQSLPWGMPFGLNALLLHFDLETAPLGRCCTSDLRPPSPARRRRGETTTRDTRLRYILGGCHLT